MLSSISPLGERARASRWWLTTAAYLIGSLAGGRLILIPRSFEIATNGEYAVLREPVFIAEPSGGAPRLLVEDCAYPGHFITQCDLLAFDCAQEAFADFLVYGVLVFDRAGRQLAKIERCRLVWDSWPKEHALIRSVIGE